MSVSNSFTVPGRPVPAVRMTQRSKYGERAQRYLAYKSDVGWSAKQAKLQPASGPVAIEVVFYFRNKRLPDVDNLLKAVMDGLNKIAWHDDRQVIRTVGERRQGEPERAEVTITYLETQEPRQESTLWSDLGKRWKTL